MNPPSKLPNVYLDKRTIVHFVTAETALIILSVIVVGLGPILTILSLNALFSLGIPLTFWTWLSVVWLTAAAQSAIKYSIKSTKG